ncbi:beta-amyrin 6-beta-monooxygenase-like [Corylus avellana]|uniref:beta-amyrin 6-beta-monooxygenase-like n=1 Tax=Corylus avellana TaxID=13451 RepID=UPI001E22FD68|nr:beta-amyrin 6-beta-monooxygenase-like [Corylus avellana]XP_059460209.1 beta-amyrin 6-beta-monooxygenase-like [Corylus avellana]
MDIFHWYLLQLLILCISLPFIFRIYRRKPISLKLPPGRKGWPIIGEALEYAMANKNGTPEKFITDRMRKYSPQVFRTSFFGENFAVFCGAPGNKFLFTSENKHVTTWVPRSILKIFLFPTDVEYSAKVEIAKIHALRPEFLNPEALQRYIPIMDSMSKQHLETDWSPCKQVKVFPLLKNYTFAVACRLFMNIKDHDQVTKFAYPFSLVSAGLLSIPINLPGTAFNRAVRAGKLIREELLGIIRKRKMELLENIGSSQVDLLSRLLLVRDENGRGMEEKDITHMIIGFFIGSYMTVGATITVVLNYLAEFPQVYSTVLKEQMQIAKSKGEDELLNWEDIQNMKYSWNVACEAMRLAPPALGAFGEVTADFSYAGFTIPKGWKTYWTVSSTHKNPEYFPDPEKFDPSRFEGRGPAPYTFVPFGGGPRLCPGKEYARVEILTFMHNVVTKFKLEKVNPNEKFIYNYNLSSIPENGLLVQLHPLNN